MANLLHMVYYLMHNKHHHVRFLDKLVYIHMIVEYCLFLHQQHLVCIHVILHIFLPEHQHNDH